jgi:hypothetical protein
VQIRDQASNRVNDQNAKQQRALVNADVGAERQDAQQRRGDLREAAFNRQDNQVTYGIVTRPNSALKRSWVLVNAK